MKTKEFSAFFVLSYDLPIDNSHCESKTKVTCLFQPKSSWRKGRNMLIRSIANYEKVFKHQFKYWLFGDDDKIRIKSCGAVVSSLTIAMSAFCFDSIVHQLSAPNIQYAAVGYVSYHKAFKDTTLVEDTLGFLHGDCYDAALTAIHHLAVPVLLPYVELLDNLTWWAPLWYHLIVGCFPGYSVYSPGFQFGNESHTPYPKKNVEHLTTKAFRQVYGPLDLIPYPITEENINILKRKQGNCANINNSQVKHSSWSSDTWLRLDSFKKCYQQLRPRFLRFIEGEDLTKIDGENYLALTANERF